MNLKYAEKISWVSFWPKCASVCNALSLKVVGLYCTTLDCSPYKKPVVAHWRWQSLWGARWFLSGIVALIFALPARNGSVYEKLIGPHRMWQPVLGPIGAHGKWTLLL